MVVRASPSPIKTLIAGMGLIGELLVRSDPGFFEDQEERIRDFLADTDPEVAAALWPEKVS